MTSSPPLSNSCRVSSCKTTYSLKGCRSQASVRKQAQFCGFSGAISGIVGPTFEWCQGHGMHGSATRALQGGRLSPARALTSTHRPQPVNQFQHHIVRQMVQELANRVDSFLARPAARHYYAFPPARRTAVRQRSTRDRVAEFLSGLRRVGEISAQSNFLVVRRGSQEEQFRTFIGSFVQRQVEHRRQEIGGMRPSGAKSLPDLPT